MKIMLVEDDEALAHEIRQFLEKWGYQVVMAERFDDVVSEYKVHLPHLVLMDINLPFYDGFYWCSKIRTVSDIPVIYKIGRASCRERV